MAELPQAVSLAELEREWGPGEGQPGPRVTYRAADYRGMYFWVYYYRPQKAGKLLEEDTFVHHIVRADRTEARGSVVWPEAKTGQSPGEAGRDLSALYRESGAGR